MHYSMILTQTIKYIEQNLDGEISVDSLTKDIGYTRHHFSRFFHAFTGYTMSSYIRMRKLDMAAKDLVCSDQGILDIAIKYGFGSQEAFSRAFKVCLGVTPHQYRLCNQYTPLLRPLDVNNIVLKRGGIELKPFIKEIEYRKIIGLVYRGDNKNQEIGMMWGQFFSKLAEIKGKRVDGFYYGLCQPVEDDVTQLDIDNLGDIEYLAGVEVIGDTEIPEGMECWEIKNQKFAVFSHMGAATTIPETYKLIYYQWLPESGFEVDDNVDFEYYDSFYNPQDENAKMQIYIPIK